VIAIIRSEDNLSRSYSDWHGRFVPGPWRQISAT
jgi:hypothetical protein